MKSMVRVFQVFTLGGLLSSMPLVEGRAQIDLSTFGEMNARSIGPAGMSGRIGAIEAVVSNPHIIYVGAATGGLWKSTTGGVTWQPIMDDLPAASIGAVAVFQNAPDIVWVGTGEKGRRNSSGVGTGIYKSMDGGHSWTHLGLAQSEAISEIILDPTNQDVAYVAALGMTWADNTERGVYKTTDGGRSWSQILYVDEKTGAADLIMDPSNPNKLFAAMWEHRRWPWLFESGGPGSGLYVTYDGGENWQRLTSDDGLPDGELGRIGLAIARGSPNVVYALVEAEKSELLRSNDGGRSFETVNDTSQIAPRPFYYAQIAVDPINENRLYNIHGRVTLSEDGGETFETLLPFNRVHPDHHAFWIHPDDGKLIIDGNDGGVYISRDRGESWSFVENLPLAQFYHISVDMKTPFNVYGGLQDNGSWRGPSRVWQNGGIRFYHWSELNFGDGFAAIIDPTNPRYAYAQSQGGFLVRRDLVTGERKNIRPAPSDAAELRFNWNAGLNIDTFDNAIYYGSQFVHRSVDLGDTWETISPDLTTNDPEKQRQGESGGLTYDVTGAENHTTILTIAPSSVERGVIWVGTDDGNVQITRDDGETWSNVVERIRNVPSGTWVPHIEPSKFDGGTAFVVFDDHRRSNRTPYLFETRDYGRSWRSLVTGEIEGFIHVIEQDPVDANLFYLGTEFGMYISMNGGQNWQLWTHGVPRAPVRALVVHPRDHDLVIGTHGRAAYILDDVQALREVTANPAIAQTPVHLFAIPSAIQYQVEQVPGMRFVADATFTGDNRPYGALITYHAQVEGDSAEVEIVIEDENGEVARTLKDQAVPGINRTAWNLRHEPFLQIPGSPFGSAAAVRVLPGTYSVRVKLGDHESQVRPLEVTADPRQTVALADRRTKYEAMKRAGQRRAVGQEAVERLKKADEAIGRVISSIAKTDSTLAPLRAEGEDLKKTIKNLQETFAGPQDRQGIVRRTDAVNSLLGSAFSNLASSWDAPTEAQQVYARQAEARLEEALNDLNIFLEEDLARFRRQVRDAGVELLPEQGALTAEWKAERE